MKIDLTDNEAYMAYYRKEPKGYGQIEVSRPIPLNINFSKPTPAKNSASYDANKYNQPETFIKTTEKKGDTMNDIIEMKNEKREVLATMRRLIDKAEREKRSLDADENEDYNHMNTQVDKLERDIINAERDLERRRQLAAKEIEIKTGKRSWHGPGTNHEKQFRNVGEFFHSIARAKRDMVPDDRLESLREQREQTMGTGATGGYALPEQFLETVREVTAQEGIVRSRAQIIPAGEPPDAKLTFPAVDQEADQDGHMYGGVTVVHTGEGTTMTETTANLREVSMEPKEISAYVVVTNKLLNNWQSAGAFTTRQLSSAMNGQEDYDFMRGNGVNQSLGFLNSAAAIDYSRAGAGAISFADCYGMLARILMRGGSYVWLASQTIIPQLAAMTDAGGHAVWLGSQAAGLKGAAGPMPSTLLGLPLVFADRLPGLGTKGDLSLVNLDYYLIKDGSGPYVASSEHILFLSNKTIFKIVWNVDAKPWLTEPLALEGSTSDTVSPFVILGDA